MGSNPFRSKIVDTASKLVYGITVVALCLLGLELLTGNGDGVWRDISIPAISFTIIAWITGVSFAGTLLGKAPSWVQNLSLSLIFLIGSVVVIDWAFGKIAPLLAKKSETSDQLVLEGPDYESSHILDPDLGLRAKPDMEFNWVKTHEGKPVQEAVIHTDQYSRRVIPVIDSVNTRDQFAVFFGCSFTFGDGLNDDETMPYYFEKLNPGFRSYNYAFFGYSTRHMLTWIDKFELGKQIAEKKGIGVYVYITDHVNRNTPSAGWISFYNGYFPDIDKSSLEPAGVYRDNHPFLYKAGMWLFDSNIRRNFRVDFPLKYRDKDYKFTADLIKKSAEDFGNKFPASDFYVILYPGTPESDPIRRNLAERGIRFFDYSKLFPFPSRQYQQTHDGHPNALAQRLVMEQFSRDLQARTR